MKGATVQLIVIFSLHSFHLIQSCEFCFTKVTPLFSCFDSKLQQENSTAKPVVVAGDETSPSESPPDLGNPATPDIQTEPGHKPETTKPHSPNKPSSARPQPMTALPPPAKHSPTPPQPPLPPSSPSVLKVDPPHMSVLRSGEIKMRWNEISTAHKYTVEISDFDNGVSNNLLPLNLVFPKMTREYITPSLAEGIYGLKVTALADDSTLITTKTVYIVLADEASRHIIQITYPKASDAHTRKKSGWHLSWTSVPDATQYYVIVVHNEKVINTDSKLSGLTHIKIRSPSAGKHDYLLVAMGNCENCRRKLKVLAWRLTYSIEIVDDVA